MLAETLLASLPTMAQSPIKSNRSRKSAVPANANGAKRRAPQSTNLSFSTDSLSHSWGLWNALKDEAGLSLKGSAYDTAMVDELRSSLTGENYGDLGRLLRKHQVPIERLLSEFLRIAAPFARMMSDVLAMFDAASAQRSDRNLKLSVQLDDVDMPLEFDLARFTEQAEQVTRAVSRVRASRLNADNLWSIWSAFQKSALAISMISNGESARRLLPTSPDVRAWLARMERGHDFPALPSRPISGHPWIDELTDDLWFEFREYHRATRGRFRTYESFMAADSSLPAEEDHVQQRSLNQAATDFWPRQIVQVLAIIAETLQADPQHAAALSLVAEIERHFPPLIINPNETETLRSELQELLNLPIWQKRHELYSVWVASQITNALRPFGVTFHPDSGNLSFPFKKTLIATIGTKPGDRLELWSELRRPAVDPVGRKGAVQPDYMLLTESTASPGDGHSTLVVECKQYLRSSTGNFSRALGDYAKANPKTRVVLLNYGPFGAGVLDKVPEHVRDYCTGLGQVRPGEATLASFRLAVSGIATIRLGWQPTTGWRMQQISVTLSWEAAADLDLHIEAAGGSCGFDTPHGLIGGSYSDDDLGHGPLPHSETITLQHAADESLDVVVDAYGGLASASEDPAARVEINWSLDGVPQRQTITLKQATARRWHVATIAKGDPVPRIVNQPRRADLRPAA